MVDVRNETAVARPPQEVISAPRHGAIGDPNRKTAVVVGVLYIVGTVAGILSLVVTGGILGEPYSLSSVANNAGHIRLGALLVLVMGLALAMVAVLLYPILRRQNEAMALGYVVFRGALETGFYIAGAIVWLLLVVVAQQTVTSDSSNVGLLLFKAGDPINAVGTIFFSLGALMLYYLLYRSRLIPRWISMWGIVGVGAYLAAGLIAVYGSSLEILFMPLALQEMVMAIWLIVKGFDTTALPPVQPG